MNGGAKEGCSFWWRGRRCKAEPPDGPSRLQSAPPITRLPAVMGNSQHLNPSIRFTVNHVEVEQLEHSTPDVGRKDDARTGGVSTDKRHHIQKFSVVTPSQSCLCFFVVGDLLGVLFSGLGVEAIVHLIHLKRACTCRCRSSLLTNSTVPLSMPAARLCASANQSCWMSASAGSSRLSSSKHAKCARSDLGRRSTVCSMAMEVMVSC